MCKAVEPESVWEFIEALLSNKILTLSKLPSWEAIKKKKIF